MDRDDCLRSLGDQRLRRAHVDAVRVRIDVGEHGCAAGEQGRGRGCLERVGRDDDLGARFYAHRLERYFERDGAVRDAEGVGAVVAFGERPAEGLGALVGQREAAPVALAGAPR